MDELERLSDSFQRDLQKLSDQVQKDITASRDVMLIQIAESKGAFQAFAVRNDKEHDEIFERLRVQDKDQATCAQRQAECLGTQKGNQMSSSKMFGMVAAASVAVQALVLVIEHFMK